MRRRRVDRSDSGPLPEGEGNRAGPFAVNADVASLNLAEFKDGTETSVFDITGEDWLHQIDGVDLVVSFLVIHQLDSTGKPRRYRNVFNRTAERGALLVVDILVGHQPSV
ncbi:MAG: hypothetical protein BZY67_03355 [SAR202 cluster bacterium Io17-Chloro-G1]|nr:MAG: hypothetical protein BZY67_03355 [SAR202 cluster bacterium Io17-Chloro-G1]